MASCASMVGDGVIRGVLGAVDCQTRAFAETGYASLTSSSSTFQVALTAILTIYVALVGWRMLFAAEGARLSDAPGMALKVGAILALVTSWANFQTLVFDLALRAPGEIAGAVAAPLQAHGGALAADPVNGLQLAYDALTRAAAAFAKAGGGAPAVGNPLSGAAQALSTASSALFMSTAGVVAAATLAIGVLTAVGPIFIALFLIPATRGFFVGWVRALGAAALVLLLGWLGAVLLLSVLEPWLSEMMQELALPPPLRPQTATSIAALIAVFSAGQAALLIAACVTAFAFRIGGRAPALSRAPAVDRAPQPASARPEPSRAQRLAFDLQREPARAERARIPRLATATAAYRGSHATVEIHTPARLGDAYSRPSETARRLKVGR
ncbi:MAG: type IV secretion system protein [Proteobacteria bacterium]|nr:type IV secretion system protein [Pseudomonadota bacterium]